MQILQVKIRLGPHPTVLSVCDTVFSIHSPKNLEVLLQISQDLLTQVWRNPTSHSTGFISRYTIFSKLVHELILANKAKNSFVSCNVFLGKGIIITGIISLNYLGSVRETKNNNQLIIKTRWIKTYDKPVRHPRKKAAFSL